MNVAQGFPAVATPLVGTDGRLSPVWYQFFVTLFQRTGGASGTDTAALQAALAALQSEVSSDERLLAFEDIEGWKTAPDPLLSEALADPGPTRAADSLLQEVLADPPLFGRPDFDQAILRALVIANEAPEVPVARANLLGISRPDGTTVSISPSGVLSATGGTVTSVGVTAPSEFTVAGSPVTGSGTITITKANEAANLVWAGPTTGVAAAPTFRGLVTADIAAALTAPGPIGSGTPGTGAFSTVSLPNGGEIISHFAGFGTTTTPQTGTDVLIVQGTGTTRLQAYSIGSQFAVLNLGSGTSGTHTVAFFFTDDTNNQAVLATGTATPLVFQINGTKVGSFGTAGDLINSKGVADQSYSYQTPATGFGITIGAGVQTLILDPAGTLATGTITMPVAPIDGQIVRVTSTQNITALTVSPNTGQSVKNAPTAFTVNLTGDQGFEFIYRLANTTWYRLQ